MLLPVPETHASSASPRSFDAIAQALGITPREAETLCRRGLSKLAHNARMRSAVAQLREVPVVH